MSNALALPASGDANTWTPQEAAIAEAAGLVNRGRVVPRPIAEAFLHHCSRTGLDPVARQIYLIERGGKHNIQVSIDGALLVAERSGKYAGHTPYQWTDGRRGPVPLREDGKIVRDAAGNPIMVEDYIWVDMWPDGAGEPMAARVGVYRSDFAEPVYAVATWNAYNAGGPMWKKMGARMLAKCAMMLALRECFPQDLSGLYSTEEMQQAGKGNVAAQTAESLEKVAVNAPAEPAPAPGAAETALNHSAPEIANGWVEAVDAAPDKVALKALYANAKGSNALALAVPDPTDKQKFISLHAYFSHVGNMLPDSIDEETGEVTEGAANAAPAADADLLAQAQAGIHAEAADGE